MADDTLSMLETIPSAAEVREKLGENRREANLLRSLLRIAEKAEKDRARREEEHQS